MEWFEKLGMFKMHYKCAAHFCTHYTGVNYLIIIV